MPQVGTVGAETVETWPDEACGFSRRREQASNAVHSLAVPRRPNTPTWRAMVQFQGSSCPRSEPPVPDTGYARVLGELAAEPMTAVRRMSSLAAGHRDDSPGGLRQRVCSLLFLPVCSRWQQLRRLRRCTLWLAGPARDRTCTEVAQDSGAGCGRGRLGLRAPPGACVRLALDPAETTRCAGGCLTVYSFRRRRAGWPSDPVVVGRIWPLAICGPNRRLPASSVLLMAVPVMLYLSRRTLASATAWSLVAHRVCRS